MWDVIPRRKEKVLIPERLHMFSLLYTLLTCIVVNWNIGYLEDRRPASNMDPYIVTSLLAETTLLWEPTLEAEALAAQKLSLNV